MLPGVGLAWAFPFPSRPNAIAAGTVLLWPQVKPEARPLGRKSPIGSYCSARGMGLAGTKGQNNRLAGVGHVGSGLAL